MTRHLLASGLPAGLAAALLATLLQFAFLENQILLAEQYEAGVLTHFAGAGNDLASPDVEAHDNPTALAQPFWQRQAKTLLTMLITYGGYGLLLVAGLALATLRGIPVPRSHALLWGLAGFAAFSLAPSLGLPPELPGGEGAPLQIRQIWWLATAAATAASLALIAYGKGPLPRIAAVVMLALPHLVGAPEPEAFSGIVPPELAASFAARSLGVSLVVWLTLSGLAHKFWTREG